MNKSVRMGLPCETAKARGDREGQRSIEDAGVTNSISSTSVDRQRAGITYANLNLRSDSQNSLVDGIATPAIPDKHSSELHKKRGRSVDGTQQGRSKRAKVQDSERQCTEILPTGSDRYNESKGKIGLLSLPGEIRNQIMDLVLVPGDVFFSNIKMQPLERERCPVSQPRCQVLATCRQLYQEGHVPFYSQNVFHLAPGPLSASWDYIKRLDSRHQDLINKVSVDLSIMDLTPAVLEGIEAAFYADHGQSIADADFHRVNSYVISALGDLWAAKLADVSNTENFQTIRLVELSLAGEPHGPKGSSLYYWRTLHLEGAGIHKLLSSIKPGQIGQIWEQDELDEHWDGVLLEFFHCVVGDIMGTVFTIFRNETSGSYWDTLKRWMRELKIRERIMDFVDREPQYLWNENSGWVLFKEAVKPPIWV